MFLCNPKVEWLYVKVWFKDPILFQMLMSLRHPHPMSTFFSSGEAVSCISGESLYCLQNPSEHRKIYCNEITEIQMNTTSNTNEQNIKATNENLQTLEVYKYKEAISGCGLWCNDLQHLVHFTGSFDGCQLVNKETQFSIP